MRQQGRQVSNLQNAIHAVAVARAHVEQAQREAEIAKELRTKGIDPAELMVLAERLEAAGYRMSIVEKSPPSTHTEKGE
jgi:aryl carrier-like protein